jgi:hypothetical protein
MFHSAVRTLKAHRIRPDARQCRLIDVQMKINSLPGLMAPTNEITHRVNSQKKGTLLAAFLLLCRLDRVS